MEGITSEALLEMCTTNNKKVLSAAAAISIVSEQTEGIILTIGAGDIDRIVQPIKEKLTR
jgi:UDP-N-acetylmuramate--alanine ligase